MILGFKDQFIDYVASGTKCHSIRAGDRWKVGMRADCYARPRQKGMRLLLRAPVVRVDEIAIREIFVEQILTDGLLTPKCARVGVAINGVRLTPDEADLLAWRDGFRHRTLAKPTDAVSVVSPVTIGCFGLMMEFWRGRLPFHGQIIHWDYKRRRMEKEIWPKGRQHPCEYIDPATHYDPPFGGAQ
jgi:hypothetical protein